MNFTDWLEPLPLVAILRGLHPDDAVTTGMTLATSGFRILEVPLNSPRPLDSIRRLADTLGDRCLIGAGTVLDADAVTEVAAAGGRLIVMPHTDIAVIAAARQAGLYCLPGVATASEAFRALRVGADALKVFPAEQITPATIKAWRAVLPASTALLPVGGITPQTMAAYLDAGASGFGIGSALFRPGDPIEAIARSARRFEHAWKTHVSANGSHA